MVDNSRKIFLGCLLVLLGVSGCTNLRRVAYKYADWFVINEIDNYFDITSEQKADLKPKVAAHVTWFRQEFSKEIITTLTEVHVRVARGLVPIDVTWARSQVEALAKKLMHRLAPDAAIFLSSLSDKQIEFFQQKLNKSNKRWEDLLAKDDADLAEAQAKKNKENLKAWLGSSTPEQVELVSKQTGNWREAHSTYLNERRAAQQTFVDLVKNKKSAKDMLKIFKSWIENPALMRPASVRSTYKKRMEKQNQMILVIEKTLSADQRKYVLGQIESIIDLLK